VEVTPPDGGEILDDSALFARLNTRFFSKMTRQETLCVFDPDEQKHIDAAKEKGARLIENIKLDIPFKQEEQLSFEEAAARFLKLWQASFVVKKPLQKTFLPLGYSYVYICPGIFEVRKITEHGFRITVCCNYKIGGACIECDIYILGANFSYTLYRKQIEHLSQADVDHLIEETSEVALLLERELEEPFFELFGSTPAWFFK
jgi:hypothetical protein